MTVYSINMRSDSRRVRWPEFFLLVYLVGTYFPLVYRFLPFLGEMKMVLLAGIALMLSYFMARGRYRNIGSFKNPVVLAWLGFLGAVFLSLAVSYDRGLTLKILEGSFKHFIVFMVMIRIINTSRRLEFILGVFSACGVAMAIVTIVNYFFLGATFNESFRAMAIELGIFGDPNDLALLFNVSLAVLLFFLMKNSRRLMALSGVLTIIIAIMLTYSRGGFIGLVLTGLGFLFLTQRKRKGLLFLGLMIAVGFWAFAPQDYRDRISTIKDEAKIVESQSPEKTRLTTWNIMIEESLKRPLLGAGGGCSYYITGLSLRDWHGVHNSFIQVFCETGFLGLCFYLLLFYLPFMQYRQSLRHHRKAIDNHRTRFQFILLALLSFGATASFLPQAYSPILPFLSGLALVQYQLVSHGASNQDIRTTQQRTDTSRAAVLQ